LKYKNGIKAQWHSGTAAKPPLYLYAVTPLRLCAITPLCLYAVTPLRLYTSAPLRLSNIHLKIRSD